MSYLSLFLDTYFNDTLKKKAPVFSLLCFDIHSFHLIIETFFTTLTTLNYLFIVFPFFQRVRLTS